MPEMNKPAVNAGPLVSDTDAATANERATADRNAESAGATSVAEAVKRVADAAVAEVQKVQPLATQDFVFEGTERGRFTIRGKGFSTNGTVRINGVQAKAPEWGDQFIAGSVPDGVRGGTVTVEVAVDEQTKQRGTFKI